MESMNKSFYCHNFEQAIFKKYFYKLYYYLDFKIAFFNCITYKLHYFNLMNFLYKIKQFINYISYLIYKVIIKQLFFNLKFLKIIYIKLLKQNIK